MAKAKPTAAPEPVVAEEAPVVTETAVVEEKVDATMIAKPVAEKKGMTIPLSKTKSITYN